MTTEALNTGYTPPPAHYVKERLELESYTIPWIDTAASVGLEIIDGREDIEVKLHKLKLIFASIQASLAKEFPTQQEVKLGGSCDKCGSIHDPKKWANCMSNCH